MTEGKKKDIKYVRQVNKRDNRLFLSRHSAVKAFIPYISAGQEIIAGCLVCVCRFSVKKISLIYQITDALFTKCGKIKREQKRQTCLSVLHSNIYCPQNHYSESYFSDMCISSGNTIFVSLYFSG